MLMPTVRSILPAPTWPGRPTCQARRCSCRPPWPRPLRLPSASPTCPPLHRPVPMSNQIQPHAMYPFPKREQPSQKLVGKRPNKVEMELSILPRLPAMFCPSPPLWQPPPDSLQNQTSSPWWPARPRDLRAAPLPTLISFSSNLWWTPMRPRLRPPLGCNLWRYLFQFLPKWAHYLTFFKEVCNRTVTYQPALAKKSGQSDLALLSKTDRIFSK